MIVSGLPRHPPAIEVGTTIYCTVPKVLLLVFVNTWLMVLPEPADAPVIFALTAPIVQVKVLGVVTVRGIFGLVLLQIVAVGGSVITGTG